jgi:hypothetical protein
MPRPGARPRTASGPVAASCAGCDGADRSPGCRAVRDAREAVFTATVRDAASLPEARRQPTRNRRAERALTRRRETPLSFRRERAGFLVGSPVTQHPRQSCPGARQRHGCVGELIELRVTRLTAIKKLTPSMAGEDLQTYVPPTKLVCDTYYLSWD